MAFHYSPKIVTDGLVLCLDAGNTKSYIGSGTWSDISRGGNNGTLTNGPTFSSLNGGSILFDGVNDSLTFSNNSNLYFLNNSSYTLSIFAKIVTSDSTFRGLINREYGSPRNGYNLWFYRDSPTVIAIASERFGGTGQKVTYILLNNEECINVWNQYLVTYDGITLKFYLNGTLTDQHAVNPIIYSNGNYFFGASFTGADQFYNGKLDEIRIYNRPLSQSEVTYLATH